MDWMWIEVLVFLQYGIQVIWDKMDEVSRLRVGVVGLHGVGGIGKTLCNNLFSKFQCVSH